MKQEENDYDTLFAIESPKKTERTGPQDFTFADGTTLRVPFKPNEQQYPGHPVKSLALLPIHVEYPAPKGFGNGTAEFTSDKNTNQLYLNGSEFREANPVLEKTIKVQPQQVEVKYEDLSDEAKAIATPVDDTINNDSQRSEETKPVDWRETLNQEFDHLRKMGINVFLHEGMQRFFEENPRAFVQMARAFGKEQPYLNSKYKKQLPQILDVVKANKYNKPGTDAVTLEKEGHKRIYLIDHSADSELADNIEKGDGFGIRKAFNVDKLSKDDCRTIIRNLSSDFGGSEAAIRHKLQSLGITSEHLSGIDIAAELKMGTDANDSMVSSRERQGFQADNNRRGTNGRESQESSRQKDRVGDDGVEMFMTPRGEVYGFIDKKNDMYLDETKISPEHPIHEYTHIWDRVIASRKPKLWQRGVELMKQTTLWNDILNDENYGKRWQAIEGLSQAQLESLIASEVHARLSGKKGMVLIEEMAKKEGQKGIIGKLKQWLLDMWKELKKTFSPWTKEDLDKLTLDDFINMTVRDFMEGINPLTAKESADNNNTINNNNNGKEQLKDTAGTDTHPSAPVLEEAKKQQLSLPNYQDHNNMNENVTVDADWKSPAIFFQQSG